MIGDWGVQLGRVSAKNSPGSAEKEGVAPQDDGTVLVPLPFAVPSTAFAAHPQRRRTLHFRSKTTVMQDSLTAAIV